MTTHIVQNEKTHQEMVEIIPNDPEALGSGAKAPVDIVTAAALVPIGGITMTPEEYILHKRVNRKLDIFCLPLITFMYLFNGLDRSNVGNAATVSFVQDINSDPVAVNNAVTAFYGTTYNLAEVSNFRGFHASINVLG
jgi:hypothetical protein